MKNILLSGKNVCKSFSRNGMETQILNSVNADIYEGDFTVIMGASGAGKSTLMYALSGMDSITDGEIFFRGQKLSGLSENKMSKYRSSEFGFVFQQTHLVSNLTLFENVAVAGYVCNSKNVQTVRDKAERLLSQMHAEKAKDRLPSQVSGGEAQRAAIARAMYLWLGSDGKGMMDAFNPADHDIGVQTFGSLTAEEAENLVKNYSEITDTYLLAMPGVAVNGVDYTANVISEPERFHILEGKACTADKEVVLTEFVAANFGVETGDTVTVTGGRGSGEYIVSGIYSCANDMGDNIGMSREGYLKIGKDDPHIWCRHYFLADTSQKAAIAEALENAYGGDVHVHENTWPGLFGIISAMQMLMIIMYGLVIIFIMVVTVMITAKILSAEQNDLGIYKAIGFGSGSLRLSVAISFGITALIGSLIGMLLAAAFTDPLVSFIMKFAGISSFSSAPTVGNILLPLCIVVGLFTLFAYAASWKIKKLPLTVLISE